MKKKYLIGLGIAFLAGLCILLTTTGAGMTLWFARYQAARPLHITPQLTRMSRAVLVQTFTPTPTASPTATATETASPTNTPTVTPSPTETATETPLPTATETPQPPTSTPSPLPPPPPTDTPTPTDTPPPQYPFNIVETQSFPTSHLNFDVYVAITNSDNHPLRGYRVIGQHSDGRQVDSAISADRWTENSGAMWYKAGNIKYQVLNSPSGVWTLQLVDEAAQPVAPPVQFSFEAENPNWYFVLYRRQK